MKAALCDMLILVGFAALVGGLWWIMPPLSMIVAGVMLIIAGLVSARAHKPKPAAPDQAASRV